MRRLLLVRHAPTSATRAASFPGDEPLDRGGRAAAASLAARVPVQHELLCGPARRCRETALAAGLVEPVVHSELAECDFGSWTGRSLADVDAADPDGCAAWMTDADACPHGGESLASLAMRVGMWLDAQAQLDGSAVAITHGGVVKAAVVHALDAPIAAFWRIDVAPLSITELHAHDGRWTVVRTNVVAKSDRYPVTTRHTRSRGAGAGGAGGDADGAAEALT